MTNEANGLATIEGVCIMDLTTLLQPIVELLSQLFNPLTALAHEIGLNLPSVSQVFTQLFGGLK